MCNVRSEKKYSMRSSNTLLSLLYFFSEQTLIEIPMSFQLPANPLASIGKLPFFGKLPIEAIGTLPTDGNLPIEAKGIPGKG